MAYSEYLADRVRQHLNTSLNVQEKKMMGGLAFMVNGHMCVGISRDKITTQDRLMIRCGKDNYDFLLKKTGARVMDFTGKPMKGFIHVYPEGYDSDNDLDFWVQQALEFNSTLEKK